MVTPVGSITSTEKTPLLLNPQNSNSIDALATAKALQLLATGNFVPAQPYMPPAAPNGNGIDPSVLMRTSQIINMSSQPPSVPPPASLPSAVVPAAPASGKLTLELPKGMYVGEIKDGVPDGRGTMTYHPGETYAEYKGLWQKGKFHGGGVLTFSGGDKMTGQWREGAMYGKGLYEFEDGGRYEGNFERSHFHGKGTLRDSNGDWYFGNWQNGKEHGQGQRTYHDGRLYDGGWASGKYEGRGDYYYSDCGISYKGGWKNGVYHGQGNYYSSEEEKTGIFNNGKFINGKWKGGAIYDYASGTYKDGVNHIDYRGIHANDCSCCTIL